MNTVTSAELRCCINMADNVAKVKQARKLAIAQLIIGLLLFCIGVAEKLMVNVILQRLGIGIVAGIWVSRIEYCQILFLYSRGCIRIELI